MPVIISASGRGFGAAKATGIRPEKSTKTPAKANAPPANALRSRTQTIGARNTMVGRLFLEIDRVGEEILSVSNGWLGWFGLNIFLFYRDG